MFQQKLYDLRIKITEYAAFIQNMFLGSVRSISTLDRNMLENIIQNDEKKANKYELDIEKLCTYFIAQYDPKAIDLRTLLMTLKINNDLERIGDHSVNISESGLFLIDSQKISIKEIDSLNETINVVSEMLSLAIKAFIDKDIKLAANIREKDNIVDDLHRQTFKDMIVLMKKNTDLIEDALHIIRISNNLERIADLTTNICEDIVYIFEATILKHKSLKDT
jgi:phosphate transport system protein